MFFVSIDMGAHCEVPYLCDLIELIEQRKIKNVNFITEIQVLGHTRTRDMNASFQHDNQTFPNFLNDFMNVMVEKDTHCSRYRTVFKQVYWMDDKYRVEYLEKLKGCAV